MKKVFVALLSGAGAWSVLMSTSMGAETACSTPASDREQIVEHIHGLFRAYLDGDREAVRTGHTEDWKGFQIKSDHIVRGIDEYMGVADELLKNSRVERYELVEVDVEVYGDRAIVFYLAKEWLKGGGGKERTLYLRAVDLYRREAGGWNQYGSNICVVPPPSVVAAFASGAGGGTSQESSSVSGANDLAANELEALLEAREAVWRAWFANDRAALKAMLPIETLGFDAGTVELADREEILGRAAQFAAAGSKLIRLEFPKTRVQAYGDVVVLYTTYLFEVETDGERHTLSGRGTEVFVKRGGRWLNSGWHLDSGK